MARSRSRSRSKAGLKTKSFAPGHQFKMAVAHGKMAYKLVWNGSAKHTSGGLTVKDIGQKPSGQLVSIKRHRAGLKRAAALMANPRWARNVFTKGGKRRGSRRGGAPIPMNPYGQPQYVAYPGHNQQFGRAAGAWQPAFATY